MLAAVVYWSGTGNTEAMANDVAQGCREAGAEVAVLQASEFSADQMDAFDAVAHLTYFSRGCPYPDKEIRHDDAPEETDAVLRALVERGKGIEINTSTYRGFGFFMPGLSVLKRYRELGGEIVTLGSDSHHVSTLGSGIQEARELLRAAGFSHYTLFWERGPQFCKL